MIAAVGNSYKRFPIIFPEDITAAVLDSRIIAAEAGFDDKVSMLISTAVSELATNILRYAGKGEILFSSIEDMGRSGIEIRAADQGPGIIDVHAAVQDHYTTTPSSLGLGLSSVKRIMDEFAIDSAPGKGTVVTARKWALGTKQYGFDIHYTLRPIEPADSVCGDAGFIKTYGNQCFFALIDAVGHGQQANDVAASTKRFLSEYYTLPLTSLMQQLHLYLQKSRGAVAAFCRLNADTRLLSFCGTGNICVRILGPHTVRLQSRDGIIGYMMASPREETLRLYHGDVMVITSDGVRENYDQLDFLDVFSGSAKNISENVIDRLGKGNDDASCLVLRML